VTGTPEPPLQVIRLTWYRTAAAEGVFLAVIRGRTAMGWTAEIRQVGFRGTTPSGWRTASGGPRRDRRGSGSRRLVVLAVATAFAAEAILPLPRAWAQTEGQTEAPIPETEPAFPVAEPAFWTAGFDLLSRTFGLREARTDLPGWYVIPFLTATAEYDSDVEVGTEREPDLILRGALGLATQYASRRVRVRAAYSWEPEWFADHSDLSNADQHVAAIDGHLRPTQPLTLGFRGSYRRSSDTKDVQVETGVVGVDVGRRDVSVARLASSARYEFGPLTSGTAAYVFTRTETEGLSTETEHELSLRGSHWLTALDEVALRYDVTFFESNQAESVVSHALMPGYTRRLGPVTTLSLHVGPRFEDSDVDVNADVRLTHRFRHAALSLGYVRESAIVAGLAGARSTDRGFVALTSKLFGSFDVGLAASVAHVSAANDPKTADTADTMVYDAGLTASYRLTSWAVVRASYLFSHEQNDRTIDKHQVRLSVVFTFPVRIADP
jgi:hypothetical protein